MGKQKIKVYFDTVSPFSYLGCWAVENLEPFKGIEKQWVPIFLGGLMKLCDNKPPIEITNKAQWINSDRVRWAHLLDIPMNPGMPPQFPILTLPTQRLLTALSIGSHSCCVPKAAMALFQAFWVDHKRIDKPDVMYEILSKPEVLGEANTKEVMEQMGSKAVKDKLSSSTQESFDVGGFGLPWFEVEDGNGNTESFWGVDHLTMMAHYLGKELPTFQSWKGGLKASL